MTVARAVRRLLGLFPDSGENPNARFEVTLRNILDQLVAQVVGSIENLVQHRLGPPLEMNRLAPSIGGGTAALDPAIILQAIEQPGESGAFDAHPLGDFFLGELVPALGEMNECPPFSLAQSEGSQALVEPGPPSAGCAEEDEAELVDVGRRHSQIG